MSAFDDKSNWQIFEVNAIGSQVEGWSTQGFDTGRVVTLEDFESDYEVVEALQGLGMLPANIEPWQVDIDGDENEFVVADAVDERPLYSLMRTSEEARTRMN